MSKVHVYSAKNVIAALGSHIPSGYSQDSFITVEAIGNGVEDDSGADGEVVINISQDRRLKISFKMQYQSATNTFLLNKYNANRLVPGSGLFPVVIKDLGGNPLVTCEQAWVVKPAGIAYGAKIGDQSWEIHGVGDITPA